MFLSEYILPDPLAPYHRLKAPFSSGTPVPGSFYPILDNGVLGVVYRNIPKLSGNINKMCGLVISVGEKGPLPGGTVQVSKPMVPD